MPRLSRESFDDSIWPSVCDADELSRQGYRDEAREWLTEIIERFNLSTESAVRVNTLVCRAACCCLNGEFRLAAEDYTRAISLEPDNPALYFYRGFAKEASEDFMGALEDFSRAIQLRPEVPIPYVFRGRVLKKTGKRSAAREDFKRVRQLASNVVTAQLMREYFRQK